MRDGQIFAMQQANARRDALMLGQFEFLKTEAEAMRRVLKTSNLLDRIKFFIWPEMFFAVCDAVQQHLLNESRKQIEAAAAKPHIITPPAQTGIIHAH